ncbi:MAG: hypothetical protein JO095_07350, partial [Alphaproteobacteria bacterium]|nr:hypothetical protein [Alphaproteobacteria bacterium]
RTKAAEPSLLAGLLFDPQGKRFTPSHAVKKGRRYRYYVSAALVNEGAHERTQNRRLAAREIEDCVVSILIDGLTNPARLLERLGNHDMPADQMRRLLARAARIAATLRSSLAQRGNVVRELVEQVVVDEKRIVIKVGADALLGRNVPADASDQPNGSMIELTALVEFKPRSAETKMVLAGSAQQNRSATCDPAMIKAIARGRAWFEELATGRAQSLRDLAERDGITRRYIRRLVDLAFLSPQLVDAILQGRQPVELTATRLTEVDLPLDWTEQHRLLTG